MADKVRFGLIGCGLISDFHGKAINASRGGVLVAAADMRAERAEACVQKYGGRAMTIDELLASPDIDVINVCTPNAYHGEYVIKAAEAGKHVLVEKPPELTLEKVDAMIAACQKAGVKLGVVLNVRTRTAIQAIKKAIDEGRFGKILAADAYMKWYRSTEYYFMDDWRSSRAAGAGVIIQHAFHYFDLLQYLAGPVEKVMAKTLNLAHPQVQLEDTAAAFFTYKSGAFGLLQASTALYPGTDIRIEINGENGTAIMVGERIDTWKFKEERPEDAEIRKIGSAAQATAAGGAADFGVEEHTRIINDMIEAVREDREPFVSAASARHTLAIALAMYESADNGGREVTVAE
ncbi:MAG TPA: Gfo/Idh/MocA family oxidoreductase [Firmicutes bacterium]|nr:Gfo/Idh/MocA family oxidoreductase [Bacillota bacterium]